MHHYGDETWVAYAMAQAPDGQIWAGSRPLRRFDGQSWTTVAEPKGLTSWVHSMLVSKSGELWIGTRTYGLFHGDGANWQQYAVDDGLASNTVQSLLETADGDIWAATTEGINRFDGRVWTRGAAPLDRAVGGPDPLRDWEVFLWTPR